MSIIDTIAEQNKDAVILPHMFDSAILGLGERCCSLPIVVYDKEKCLQILMDQNNWDHDESVEYFDYNIIGSYVSEFMPIFLETIK